MVVLVVLFVLRYLADFCGRLLFFCVRFVLICGRFVGCADLRPFVRKTGSITKTTRIFGSWKIQVIKFFHLFHSLFATPSCLPSACLRHPNGLFVVRSPLGPSVSLYEAHLQSCWAELREEIRSIGLRWAAGTDGVGGCAGERSRGRCSR